MSKTLYEIKRLKLAEKQIDERESLVNERLFTFKDIEAAQNLPRSNDAIIAALVGGACIGAFIVFFIYAIISHR